MYKITCTLGWRLYTERFKDAANARAFVIAMLGKDKPKWKNENKIVAKPAETLWIECDDLEEVMEAKKEGILHADTKDKIQKFLFGVWDQKHGAPEGNKKALDEQAAKENGSSSRRNTSLPAASKSNGDTISLKQLCKQHGWDDRKARSVLRRSDAKREGRWEWSKQDIGGIEDALRKAFGKNGGASP